MLDQKLVTKFTENFKNGLEQGIKEFDIEIVKDGNHEELIKFKIALGDFEKVVDTADKFALTMLYKMKRDGFKSMTMPVIDLNENDGFAWIVSRAKVKT